MHNPWMIKEKSRAENLLLSSLTSRPLGYGLKADSTPAGQSGGPGYPVSQSASPAAALWY